MHVTNDYKSAKKDLPKSIYDAPWLISLYTSNENKNI